MRRLGVSSPGVLLIAAVIAAGAICLLDVFYCGPHVAQQRDAALRGAAVVTQNTVLCALEAEQKRLASLCEVLARDDAGLSHLRGSDGPGEVDAAWRCGPEGRVEQGWWRDGLKLSSRTLEQASADLSMTHHDVGLMQWDGGVAVYARSDIQTVDDGVGGVASLCLVRRLDSGLLSEIGLAAGARLRLVQGGALPTDPPLEAGTSPMIWPIGTDRLLVAWPVLDEVAEPLGFFRAEFLVGGMNRHVAAARQMTLIILTLSGGMIVLVIFGASILLANPINRLMRRVQEVESGQSLSEAEFTKHLHVEPRALARKLQKTFHTITRASHTDELTGLANRRQFQEALDRALLESKRYHRPLSVLALDIDLFKAVNDTAGHKTGDDLICLVAEAIVHCCREADLPARFGGDEFVVLLPETAAAGAAVVAERICQSVPERSVTTQAVTSNVTVSIGIADLNAGRVDTSQDLVSLADRALYAAKQHGRNRFFQAHELAADLWASEGGEAERVDQLHEKLDGLDMQFKSLFVRTLQEIVDAQERRDSHMAFHARKVQRCSALIARRMYLPEDQIKQVEVAALLHDIGMLALPDSVALCAGRLNEQQYEAMQRHSLIGARILEGLEFLTPVIPIVRSHHERFDGQGYPDGLAGQSIPLAARIVAVADVYDAMVSPRTFRGAKSPEEALAEIRAEAGAQLDPDVVTAFLAEVDRLGDAFHEASAASALVADPVI
jgi:diguanylate cyclase (GGDEF)-like protein